MPARSIGSGSKALAERQQSALRCGSISQPGRSALSVKTGQLCAFI